MREKKTLRRDRPSMGFRRVDRKDGRDCHLKVTLNSVEYDKGMDDIGDSWKYTISIRGQPKSFPKHTMQYGGQKMWNPQEGLIFDGKAGLCGDELEMVVAIEATEVGLTANSVGSVRGPLVFRTNTGPCPFHQTAWKSVVVTERILTGHTGKEAFLRFWFDVEATCPD